MRLLWVSLASVLSLVVAQTDPTLDGPRSTNILADIRGLVPLPDQDAVVANGTLNIADIQGDVLVGMKKQQELFIFFSINNVTSFKKKLRNKVVPRITSTFQLLDVQTQPIVAVNLAFSRTGLAALGFDTNLGDIAFGNGQAAAATSLGDPGTTNWIPAFVGQRIHGVLLLGSDQTSRIQAMAKLLNTIFDDDITTLYSLQGAIRSPPFDGHEMFGFLDGIGQPAVQGFNINPLPGQQVVQPGVILTGEPGDTVTRPSWAKDGSFLVFRQLQQLVPEFNSFLTANAPPVSGMTQAESAELLGARMVGRWKSGAPVDLNPTQDNATMGADPMMNNNFDFTHPGFKFSKDQSHCPFGAHIRKTRPRADDPAPTPIHSIMRAGIPYGPEVTNVETNAGASSSASFLERGLAFVAYQANIGQGFEFITKQWVNNQNFPSKNETVGFDPIIGANKGNTRTFAGYDIEDASLSLTLLLDFVVSRGGEYFFTPSISALNNTLSV